MYMRGSDTFHSTTSRLWLCPRGRACKPQRRNRRPRATTWSTYRTRVSLWGRVRKSSALRFDNGRLRRSRPFKHTTSNAIKYGRPLRTIRS